MGFRLIFAATIFFTLPIAANASIFSVRQFSINDSNFEHSFELAKYDKERARKAAAAKARKRQIEREKNKKQRARAKERSRSSKKSYKSIAGTVRPSASGAVKVISRIVIEGATYEVISKGGKKFYRKIRNSSIANSNTTSYKRPTKKSCGYESYTNWKGVVSYRKICK